MPVNAVDFSEGALCVGAKVLRDATLFPSSLAKVQKRDRERTEDVVIAPLKVFLNS